MTLRSEPNLACARARDSRRSCERRRFQRCNQGHHRLFQRCCWYCPLRQRRKRLREAVRTERDCSNSHSSSSSQPPLVLQTAWTLQRRSRRSRRRRRSRWWSSWVTSSSESATIFWEAVRLENEEGRLRRPRRVCCAVKWTEKEMVARVFIRGDISFEQKSFVCWWYVAVNDWFINLAFVFRAVYLSNLSLISINTDYLIGFICWILLLSPFIRKTKIKHFFILFLFFSLTNNLSTFFFLFFLTDVRIIWPFSRLMERELNWILKGNKIVFSLLNYRMDM